MSARSRASLSYNSSPRVSTLKVGNAHLLETWSSLSADFFSNTNRDKRLISANNHGVHRRERGVTTSFRKELTMAPRSRLRQSDPPTQDTSAADTPVTGEVDSNDNEPERETRIEVDEYSSMAVCLI